MADLTVIILTYNESIHIARAIASVRDIASQVIVVDSGSTDDTVSLAEELGARVLVHPFVNQAQQFQWALDHASVSSAWLMRLDADEVVSAELSREIARKLPQLSGDVVGVNLKRRHVFMGKWVRHGGRYPLRLLRMWRTGHGRVENRWMDEHVHVWGGATIDFDHDFSDVNLNDLGFFTSKHNNYALREAMEIVNQRHGLFGATESNEASSTSRQAAIKRWIKEKVYNRIPFTVSSLLYFVWRYVFQLGFLDGRRGLVYHFLQGYWYRFLVGAKAMELEHAIANAADRAGKLAILSRLTGYDLTGNRREG